VTSLLDVRGLTVEVADARWLGAAGEWSVAADWRGRIAGTRTAPR